MIGLERGSVWELEPLRRFGRVAPLLLVVIRDDELAPLALELPVSTRPVDGAFLIEPRAPGEWFVAADRFHRLLPRDALLLTHAPMRVGEELRAL